MRIPILNCGIPLHLVCDSILRRGLLLCSKYSLFGNNTCTYVLILVGEDLSMKLKLPCKFMQITFMLSM